MIRRLVIIVAVWLSAAYGFGQTVYRGQVVNEDGNALAGVNITIPTLNQGTTTDGSGRFEITIAEDTLTCTISYVGYKTITLTVGEMMALADRTIRMVPEATVLEELEVVEDQVRIDAAPVLNISSESARLLPSAFGEFSQVLATLPGVANNNELSSTYSVRGGNFDENLVYVNDIPIYRPFLANSGRQEGLSFVNPDLVRNINFYAGGWAPKYGDKLSSSLNIEYKRPEQLEGAATVGLLGGTAYVGGYLPKARASYLVGARHRDSRYLLNTLEVDGQYFPTFSDIQAFSTIDLSKRQSGQINRTTLSLLFSYARNRYLTEPASLETEFGSVQQNFRLQTAFEGREILNYDTFQGGARFSHRWNDFFNTDYITSAVQTYEREDFEVEGAYRLCDVDNDPGSSSFEECVVTRGVGTNYNFGRNQLGATILTHEIRNQWLINSQNNLEFGGSLTYQAIEDEIDEFAFVDSVDFVTITEQIHNSLDLNSFQYAGFIQNTTFFGDSTHILTYGVRFNYWDENNEWLVSPRMQYLLRLSDRTNIRLATGIYSQPPFYRELRDRRGEIVEGLLAQKSAHFILGWEQGLSIWGRDFVLTSEIYWKLMWDVVPYDVENIRLRYFANNDARAFARGVDFRINGEFISGTQSWFSLGILQVQEDVAGDNQGFIRRPTDQRVNLGAYFEDHLPLDPTLRVYFTLNVGSGYPFGPPEVPEFRNAFSGDEYYRVDLGISKHFYPKIPFVREMVVRAEMLNALAADNTLSYIWIEDVNGANFAVPNSLSARFLNIKFTTKF